MTGTRNLNPEPYRRPTLIGRDKHKLRPGEPLLIAWDGYDLSWVEREAKIVVQMWIGGASVATIADALSRDETETVLLLAWLADTGKIELKAGEILGWVGA